MNVLADAINNIQTLAPLQECIIKTYEIGNNKGFANEMLTNEVKAYAHIQPITPSELKLFTDSTLDSAKCYKFFFIGENAKLIHSLDLPIENSYIEWQGLTIRVYGIRDWYFVNGWVAIYVTISKQN